MTFPLIFLAFFSSTLLAAPAPENLLDPGAALTLELQSREGGRAVTRVVSVAGQAFEGALAVRVEAMPKNPWELQLVARTKVPAKKGDKLLLDFWMRGAEGGGESSEATVGTVVEMGKEPWTKSLETTYSSGRGWRRIQVPFEMATDNFATGTQVGLRLGYRLQTVEIASLGLWRYPASALLKDLPQTKLSYGGRESDAPWRRAAEDRIEKIRKGDLQIRVRHKDGTPAPGMAVKVLQRKQAFGFGSAIDADLMMGESPEQRRFQAEASSLFNVWVPGNDLKLGPWLVGKSETHPLFRWSWTLGTLQKARSLGIQARGHNMHWPGWNFSGELKPLAGDRAALARACDARITDVGKAVRGLVQEWDVVNEPFHEHDILDLLGPGTLAKWFSLARQVDPEARLFINEYGILEGGGNDQGAQKGYEAILDDLVARKAPFDGIGLQAHFGTDLPSMDKCWQLFERFGRYGKDLEITEYDMASQDEQLASDYLRDLLTLFYSHPRASAFVMWGFWDGRHWKENAPLLNKDWSPKKALAVWKDLTRSRWMTSAQAGTDKAGLVKLRGFLGDYEVEVAGKKYPLTLPKEGSRLEVTVP